MLSFFYILEWKKNWWGISCYFDIEKWQRSGEVCRLFDQETGVLKLSGEAFWGSPNNWSKNTKNIIHTAKYIPCGPSIVRKPPETETSMEVSGRFPDFSINKKFRNQPESSAEVSRGFRTIHHWRTTRYLFTGYNQKHTNVEFWFINIC